MKYNITVNYNGRTISKKAEAGANLLDFLRSCGFEMDFPCGGKGTCGKCRVKVSGMTDTPSDNERKLLGKALDEGIRLACHCTVNSDIEVYMESKSDGAQISTDTRQFVQELDPIVKKRAVRLERPDIEDQRTDIERLMSAARCLENRLGIDAVRELPRILRDADFNVTLVYSGSDLFCVEPGDTGGKCFGIAVDIGTTTIAAYLYDLVSGRRADVHSTLNPQKKFGADVISRIEYASSSTEAAREMHREIVSCINRIVSDFSERNGIGVDDIYAITFVGNTTMMHFLLNLPAGNIAVSPFIPVSTDTFLIKAAETGLQINKNGLIAVLPGVSAYVGADTVAAVLSSSMHESDEITLLVDIGTNGEIVLGNKKWMYSCSAAAGPAFEGANIRNGIGGVRGAIDKIEIGDSVRYTTIGKERAKGICGSGIVDAVAGLLKAGIIDETGRIISRDEADGLPPRLLERLIEIDGRNAFLLLHSSECDSEIDIAITQKDVRELQNAKAAIAAGIKILIKQAGIDVSDIDRVYLAGGFGNYIDRDNAVVIGLLPRELKDRIESIGNAAGAGAVGALLSQKQIARAAEIKKMIKYVELSACPEFMDEFVESMLFG